LWSGAIDPTEEGWLDRLFDLKKLPASWREMSCDVLNENTDKALKAGAFGVPTFVLHGSGRAEMFFGIDHMDFLERACQRQNP
jgi:2-hydroxychromene-2-carboxylate isomerase